MGVSSTLSRGPNPEQTELINTVSQESRSTAIQPSQIKRTLASYPRQNALAVALREVGRIERTLFIARCLTDNELQRRAQISLNKGEALHALKNALRIGRQGEIRDRTSRA